MAFLALIERKFSISRFLYLFLIFFRDIKGANILVDPCGDIKLADFGMAKHVSQLPNLNCHSYINQLQ